MENKKVKNGCNHGKDQGQGNRFYFLISKRLSFTEEI
jgi:hypothetical protein